MTVFCVLCLAGYVGPSQVMYGIQAAAAACPFVAYAGPLELIVGWQPQSAADMLRALVGMLALAGVLYMAWHFSCALECRFSVIEGLDRHVLAGSLFSGTGEQADGWTSPARTSSSKPWL